MLRKTNFAPGEYYHIYNRGIDRRLIFNNKNDYERFLMLLYLCNDSQNVDLGNLLKGGRAFSEIINLERKENLVAVGSYCLMPNHFHLLIFEKKQGGISAFMQKLQTAYSMYFNKKYDRSGSLFQGVFKAKHVAEENYLMYLFAYIHLNPVKLIDSTWKEQGLKNPQKAREYLKKYQYSSYFDFINFNRSAKNILTLDDFPRYFNSENSFENFVDWFNNKKGYNLY